jgi:hypothetical protein
MVGVEVRSLSCPFALFGRPVRAPRDPRSSVAPRHSQRACSRSSVDFRTCRDRRPHRAKCLMRRRQAPFNVWRVDAAHLPGELDCRPLFRPLTSEVAGSSPFFARPSGSEMGARENGLRRLSFPPDDDEEFGGGRGKRVNRPPLPHGSIFYATLRSATILHS